MVTILHLHALLTLAGPLTGDTVYGCVRNRLRESPLQGVQVEADGAGAGAVTDLEGRYSLRVEAAGARQLRFTRAGYHPLAVAVTVAPGRSLHLDVDLDPIPTSLPSIEVSAAKVGLPSDGGSGAGIMQRLAERRFDARTLREDPLSAGGDFLLAATGSPAGDALAGYPSSIHLRGGASDHNQLLLDGTPVYGAMHLGGASSLFNPDAIGGIEVQAAVPPASFSGRLSSAIEVQLRPDTARRVTAAGAGTPVWLRQTVEVPLARGHAAVLVSGQRSYRGLFAQDHEVEQEANGFEDLLVRGSLALKRDHLDLYLIQGHDHLGFPAVAQPAVEGGESTPNDAAGNRFDWSVNTEALVWRRRAGGAAELTGRAWHAGTDARIDWAAAGGAQRLADHLDETGARLELRTLGSTSHALLGLEIRRPSIGYQVGRSGGDSPGVSSPRVRLRSAPTILGAFAQGERALDARWTVRVGLRANSLSGSDAALEPRLSVAYRISHRLAAFAGFARLHQYAQSFHNEESLLDYAFGADLLVGTGPGGLRPARSDQLSATFLAELGRRTTLRIDGYARGFTGLALVPLSTAGPFADRLPPIGSGEAWGVEGEISHRAAAFDLRATAGTGRTERQSEGGEFVPKYQRSAWLVLGASAHVLPATVLRLAATASVGDPTSTLGDELEWQSPGGLGQGSEISGSPQTIQGPVNRDRLPPYFRCDIGLERAWPARLAGIAGRVTSSVVVTNVLNRMNPLAYIATPGSSARRTIHFPARSLGLRLGWQF